MHATIVFLIIHGFFWHIYATKELGSKHIFLYIMAASITVMLGFESGQLD